MRQVPHFGNGENEAQKIIFLVKNSEQVCVTTCNSAAGWQNYLLGFTIILKNERNPLQTEVTCVPLGGAEIILFISLQNPFSALTGDKSMQHDSLLFHWAPLYGRKP